MQSCKMIVLGSVLTLCLRLLSAIGNTSDSRTVWVVILEEVRQAELSNRENENSYAFYRGEVTKCERTHVA